MVGSVCEKYRYRERDIEKEREREREWVCISVCFVVRSAFLNPVNVVRTMVVISMVFLVKGMLCWEGGNKWTSITTQKRQQL